jgi:hypothetical protein
MHFLADGLHTSTVDVNSVDEWPRRGDDLFLGLLRAYRFLSTVMQRRILYLIAQKLPQ